MSKREQFAKWRDWASIIQPFLTNALHSLYTDPDSVAKVPGDGFGPDMLECGVCEAIKTDLLFGDGFQLELVAA